MINKQGPGKIDWTDWSWNPISGCLHACPYCYMLRMEKRFPGITKPDFHFDRIDKFLRSKKVKPGHKVFVGSSGDMWGEWVEDEWIDAVLDVVELCPEVTFQFLTKNPSEYQCWDLLNCNNAWFGTSVDGMSRTANNLSTIVKYVPYNVKFVSFEPLISWPEFDISDFSKLDWIIIGADSTMGAKQPPEKWGADLRWMAKECGIPVWIKDNFPWSGPPVKEFPDKNVYGGK